MDLTGPHSTPKLPRRLARRPESFEHFQIANGVHALPEVAVPIGHQLSRLGQPLQGLSLQRGFVAVNILQDLGFQNEESAVYPSFADLWLLGEFSDLAIIARSGEIKSAKAGRWPHGRHRGQFAMPAMKRHQFLNIDIRDAITICEHEGRLADVVT